MLARGLEIYLPKITAKPGAHHDGLLAKRNREIWKNLVKCHVREEFDIDLISYPPVNFWCD